MPQPSRYICKACKKRHETARVRCDSCGSVGQVVQFMPAPQPPAPSAPVARPPVPVTVPATPASQVQVQAPVPMARGFELSAPDSEPVQLDTEAVEVVRISTGMPDLDRLFGGGLIRGMVIAIYGDPGAGKSTLLTQIAGEFGQTGDGSVYQALTEETVPQVTARAKRLGYQRNPNVWVHCINRLEAIEQHVRVINPAMVIVDSMQEILCANVEGRQGSLPQIEEAVDRLTVMAKQTGRIVIMVFHVTKDGTMAGPKSTAHTVDMEMKLEMLPGSELRRLVKNKDRGFSTAPSLTMEMTSHGLVPVSRASLVEDRAAVSGSVVAACSEGERMIYLLVQAMVAVDKTTGASARRLASGIEVARANIICSVLASAGKLDMGGREAVVQIAGGAVTDDPAVDLAVAIALISSYWGAVVPIDYIVFGEVGLGGELRPVLQLEERLIEAPGLGFHHAIVPMCRKLPVIEGLEITTMCTIEDVVRWVIGLAGTDKPRVKLSEDDDDG